MATSPRSTTLDAPFVLSLLAGILVLGGGVMMTFSLGVPYYGGMMGGHYGMMGGYYGMMQGFGFGGWFYILAVLGLLSGAVILIGAMMVYTQLGKVSTWGALILIFSILSFFGMGGFFLGGILGVVGGALALTWKSRIGDGEDK